jgi:hypothetical protein
MRLWLRDSERKPDPVPAETDDRKAILVGLALWVVALIVVVVVTMSGSGFIAPDAAPATLWTCAVGITLGLIGLAYTHRLHKRR